MEHSRFESLLCIMRASPSTLSGYEVNASTLYVYHDV